MKLLKKFILIFIVIYAGYIIYATVYYLSTGNSRAQTYITPTNVPITAWPPRPISLPPQPPCLYSLTDASYHNRCGSKLENIFKRVNFRCADDSRGELRSKNCLTEAELKLAAFESCKAMSRCPTPTLTPTPAFNSPPTITTNYLSTATLGQNYTAYVIAVDKDYDVLTMYINALPPGLSQGPCQLNPQPISLPPLQTTGTMPPYRSGFISCSIYGTPTQSGSFNIHISVQDGVNNPVLKLIPLKVGPKITPPFCPTLTPPPCEGGYLQKQEPSPENGLICPYYYCIQPTLVPS